MTRHAPTSDATAGRREQLLATLRDVWGYDSFRPLQERAMEAVMERRDSVVILPTGGGKSVCFQAPALLRPGTAVVVSPLISLMRDQVAQLRQNGVIAGCLHSGQPTEERSATIADMRSGDLRLLYLSPERLALEDFGGILRGVDVSFLVVDEAHCISMWGHDFRPEYRQISRLRENFPGVDIHAYTATATQEVARDIAVQLGLRSPEMLRGSCDRPNLHYAALPRSGGQAQVEQVVRRHPGESGIVYCITRREVDRTAAALERAGHRAVPYHAGMEAGERLANQEAFVRDRASIAVATVAFGMGINKPDVRFVVHMGMPKSIENYQQESGRAGRDGLAAECVLLFSYADVVTWRKIGSEAPDELRRASNAKLDEMLHFAQSTACRRRLLLAHFGESFAPSNCGRCDNCTGGGPPVADSTIIAQKILSCVKRAGEAHPAGHIARVLTGSRDARIQESGHDRLSTFGLLSTHDRVLVGDWIAQLVSGGQLEEVDGHALVVTPAGWEVLRGSTQVALVDRMRARATAKATADAGLGEGESADFARLREFRKSIAASQKVAPFMVFSDVTLREIVRSRPRNLAEFARIRGVGQAKLDAYGESFLDALWEGKPPGEPAAPSRGVVKRTGRGERREEAYRLFAQGLAPAEVAQRIARAVSTTEGYLAEYLDEKRVTDPSPWVDPEIAREIERIADANPDGRLAPINEAMQGRATYMQIRAVLTCRINRIAAGN